MVTSGNASSKKLTATQLGFSVAFEDQEHRSFVGHNLPLWRDWDGGQIGGRPSWLQPRGLPKEFLTCKNCEEPLCFICQLYAPTDEVNPDAFHRSLYVFGCPSSGCAEANTGSIRVLRTQLPRANPFYPDAHDEKWSQHIPEAWDVELCKVCGQRGKGKCPIQGYHFCGKHHQKEHKHYIFDKQTQLSKQLEFTFLPSVCAESELEVEEEPGHINGEEDMIEKSEKALFPNWQKDGKAEDGKDDEDLEQDDLNEAVGAAKATVSEDAATMEFYDRIKSIENVQEQVLRYLRWPDDDLAMASSAPLWIRSDHQPKDIEACPYCGADRKFEFQIMPQMLHYLLKDHELNRASSEVRKSIKSDVEAIKKASSILEQAPKEQIPPSLADAKEQAVSSMRSKLMGENGDKELSWGVVTVYTCTASCGNGAEVEEGAELGAYREEFAWKQPAL